ncbi:DNA-binding response regulator [Hydrogenophaga crassostreae]|uniref:DNA-binding response regulator n=1 Tax=Hydrogenophaga crassostreae TaxID=1763535 RepID=A0A167GJK8_9BURK|nr:response regulator [Hydrogenophaga crassostreae]AOW15083.1 DNA-binding response regulator [Hydrogenophaga crassostreae]OAD39536.1 DNA-binding response regulator [Hydrogenophaga crassostreae]
MNDAAPLPRIQILLVDDHNLFRRGLRALLEQDERFEVCGEAGDVGEALRRLALCQPDLILLDNHLPGVHGVDAIPSLKEAAAQARILMLTVSENENDLSRALQAGADGYLLKTVESEQLCDAIIKVLDGESVISPEMMTKLVSVFRTRPAQAASVPQAMAPEAAPCTAMLASLSPREREILLLIANGDSNKLIARALNIAETTVKIHVQHILRKLGLSSRVQAAVYATSQGMT